ncbi:unnamed protein product [Plutella xylostella]|uniref:(diamondback moth) hypothetical protein n=1 Tax=Plutella xylostella TaxID=51655 RepID=A0A8S4DKL1_PLUXY|nr:unnamed protein product [Plutella xylostella]
MRVSIETCGVSRGKPLLNRKQHEVLQMSLNNGAMSTGALAEDGGPRAGCNGGRGPPGPPPGAGGPPPAASEYTS